jgi:hypothetical protein
MKITVLGSRGSHLSKIWVREIPSANISSQEERASTQELDNTERIHCTKPEQFSTPQSVPARNAFGLSGIRQCWLPAVAAVLYRPVHSSL